MILITSAAYVDQDFVTEIGLIPPSFLPVQNRRLYELQVEMLREQDLNDAIYLSIPESFKLNSYDAIKIKSLGIRIIRVPDGISLGESVLYCWNSSASYHENFRILHGDTLFIDMALSHGDEISTHPNKGFYKRASISNISKPCELKAPDTEWANDDNSVLSGYFSFNSPLIFIKSLIENKMDFVSSIRSYHSKKPMELNS